MSTENQRHAEGTGPNWVKWLAVTLVLAGFVPVILLVRRAAPKS